MAYPEKGAGYTRHPKFIDRMKEAEGVNNTPYRADGGPTGNPKPPLRPTPKPPGWVGNKEGWDDETGSQMTPYEMQQALKGR
jgi:hypothetical protein